MTRKRMSLVGATVVACIGAAVFAAASFGDSPTAVIANFTPATVKIKETGGTVPSPGYTPMGRVTLPVGSWVIDSTMQVYSVASRPTTVDCWLMTPDTQPGHTAIALGNAKGTNRASLSIVNVTTTPTGGSVDLICRVTDPAASRAVFAQGVKIIATQVNGATVTRVQPTWPAP